MSQLHQIQLQYDAHEDRGLLRISTQDGAEYRFWMTRRYVKVLWPILLRMVSENEQVARQADPAAKRTVLSFQHEQALGRSDFATRYQEEEKRLPLGQDPILLARVQLKRAPSGSPVLCMHPLEGQGIELAMNDVLVHSLCKLVGDVVRQAEWDVDADIERATADAEAPRRVN